MVNEEILSKPKVSYFTKLKGVILWSLIRHKYLVPVFSVAQAAFSVAIICGMALFLPQLDDTSVVYLASGALTLGMIAVGCVLAPQIVSEGKQNGIFEYQRTLPVSRSIILLADIIIWGIASLPGVIMGCVASMLRFDINLNITVQSCLVILLTQFTMICIGFCIAYWLPPNAMALATQVIMIGGLLFSPITYPAERLPEWSMYIYNVLPFVPMSNLIRASLFLTKPMDVSDLIVVIFWAVAAFVFSLCALSKKE